MEAVLTFGAALRLLRDQFPGANPLLDVLEREYLRMVELEVWRRQSYDRLFREYQAACPDGDPEDEDARGPLIETEYDVLARLDRQRRGEQSRRNH